MLGWIVGGLIVTLAIAIVVRAVVNMAKGKGGCPGCGSCGRSGGCGGCTGRIR